MVAAASAATFAAVAADADLTCSILNFLRNPSRLLVASRVCRLWHRLSMADKLVTQSYTYGGLWMTQILEEVRDHCNNIERHAEHFGLGKDEDIRSAIFHLRTRARENEMQLNIYRDDPDWNG